MLDLLDFDRLEEILVLIIPGFVSLKVWTLINPTARLKLADYLLDIIAFSALNFAALSWLLAITTDSPLWLRIIVGIGVFIGAPAAWPVLLRATLNWRACSHTVRLGLLLSHHTCFPVHPSGGLFRDSELLSP